MRPPAHLVDGAAPRQLRAGAAARRDQAVLVRDGPGLASSVGGVGQPARRPWAVPVTAPVVWLGPPFGGKQVDSPELRESVREVDVGLDEVHQATVGRAARSGHAQPARLTDPDRARRFGISDGCAAHMVDRVPGRAPGVGPDVPIWRDLRRLEAPAFRMSDRRVGPGTRASAKRHSKTFCVSMRDEGTSS